jgi:hypothetical protein
MSHATTSHTAAPHVIAGKVISMSRQEGPHSASPVAASSGAVGRQLPTDEELREISASLRGLCYGSVSIVVQDGVIIQIDRVEKRRLRNRQGNDNSRA